MHSSFPIASAPPGEVKTDPATARHLETVREPCSEPPFGADEVVIELTSGKVGRRDSCWQQLLPGRDVSDDSILQDWTGVSGRRKADRFNAVVPILMLATCEVSTNNALPWIFEDQAFARFVISDGSGDADAMKIIGAGPVLH